MLWCLVVVADCGVDLLDWLLIVRFSGVLLGSCCVFSLLLCWVLICGVYCDCCGCVLWFGRFVGL